MSEQIKKKRGRPPKQLIISHGDLIIDDATPSSLVQESKQDILENEEQVVTTDDLKTVEPQQVSITTELNKDSEEKDSDELSPAQPEQDGCSTLLDFINNKETFKYDSITWTPHKFNIGDTVWVPQEEVLNTSDMFSFIKASLQFVPKKFTVATVVFTNKVSYTFKETSKVIASENYVCESLEQCAKLCSELN